MYLVWSSSSWILLGLCAVLLVWWIWRMVSAVRMIARRPAVSVEALNLHDASVGWIARALALVAYFAIGFVPSIWWPAWSQDGAWPLSIAGVVTAIGLIVMELRWPVPGGTVRLVGLRRRSMRDIVPRAGTSVAALGLLFGAGAIIVCGWIGAPARLDAGQGTPVDSASTWPSWGQTAPYSIGLALVVAVTAVAALVLVRRPALAGMSSVIDIAYRRAALDRALRVVGAAGFLVAAKIVGSLNNYASFAFDRTDAALSLGRVFVWQAILLFVVAFISIDLFRTKLPKAAEHIPVAQVGASLS